MKEIKPKFTLDVQLVLTELIRLAVWRDGLDEKFLKEYRNNLEGKK